MCRSFSLDHRRPARPIDRIAAGAAVDIGLLVGANVDEHRLFLASLLR